MKQEQDNDDFDKELKAMLAIFLWFIIGAAICSLFGACKSQYVDISEDMFIHDTTYVYNLQKDSIFLHDSVYMERWYQGDTVYLSKYVEHIAYKDRVKHDSIYINKQDTIVKTVIQEVPAKKSWIDKTMETLGGIFMIVLFIALASLALFFIVKKYKI